MAARLVGDKLDLNLSPLASGLIVVIVVVVGGRGTLAFDASRLDWIPVSDGMLIKGGWRTLVVLIRDVGHCGKMDL